MNIQDFIQSMFSQVPPEKQSMDATMVDPKAFLQPGLTMDEAKGAGLARQQQVAPLSTAAGMIAYNAIPGMGMGGDVSGALSPGTQSDMKSIAQQHIDGLMRSQINGRALSDAEQSALAFLQKNKNNVQQLRAFYPELDPHVKFQQPTLKSIDPMDAAMDADVQRRLSDPNYMKKINESVSKITNPGGP